MVGSTPAVSKIRRVTEFQNVSAISRSPRPAMRALYEPLASLQRARSLRAGPRSSVMASTAAAVSVS
jgi:hypothetical protein